MAGWWMSRNARRPLPTRNWTIDGKKVEHAAEEFGENVLIVDAEERRRNAMV